MRTVLPLLFLYVVFMAACKKPQTFDYRDIKNIKVENWQAEKSKVSMDIVYFNPNDYGVNLKKVDCEIYIDSSYVGTFHLDTLMHIPKNAEFTIPTSMEVDMKTILKNALGVVLGNPVLIGAKGTTRVGKGGFYVTVPFSYEGKHKLNLF